MCLTKPVPIEQHLQTQISGTWPKHAPNSPTKPQTFSCSIRSAKSGIQLLNGFKPWIGGIKQKGTNKPTNHAITDITDWHSCQVCQVAWIGKKPWCWHRTAIKPWQDQIRIANVTACPSKDLVGFWILTLSPTCMTRGELSTASCSLLITTRPARFQCSNQTGTKVLRITHWIPQQPALRQKHVVQSRCYNLIWNLLGLKNQRTRRLRLRALNAFLQSLDGSSNAGQKNVIPLNLLTWQLNTL